MKTTITVKDSRINRDNNVLGYMELCTDLVQAQGYDKTFTCGNNSSSMSWDEFKTWGYAQGRNDSSIAITLNFNTSEAIITVDAPEKSKLDEEMELWEARSNDEFGQTLKEINAQAFADWFNEEDEYGITTTPISYYITAYSLDGDRKYTAKKVLAIIEDYDMMEDVKELAEKLNRLAA